MRRRRGEWTLLLILSNLVNTAFSFNEQPTGYDAQPINTPANGLQQQPQVHRGYQPPPQPLLFKAPRSGYNSAPPPLYAGQHHTDEIVDVPPSTFNGYIQSTPENNEKESPRNNLNQKLPQSLPPSRMPSVLQSIQYEVAPANPMGENPPDFVNNIIIHIYLNSKEKMKKSHTEVYSGPIRGMFGTGTSHGGPGSHINPIVITKDFDRETLEFLDEETADQITKENSSNVIEVKATVSTPDRKIQNALNKAVNNELDRAIPIVVNRMQSPMNFMNSRLRSELEQALVDEIAKNLGEAIDEMSGSITEEDLGKLIEEGFNEINRNNTFLSTKAIVMTTTSIEPLTTETPLQTTARPNLELLQSVTTSSLTEKPFNVFISTGIPEIKETTTLWRTRVEDRFIQTTPEREIPTTTSEVSTVTTPTPPPRTFRIKTTIPISTSEAITEQITTTTRTIAPFIEGLHNKSATTTTTKATQLSTSERTEAIQSTTTINAFVATTSSSTMERTKMNMHVSEKENLKEQIEFNGDIKPEQIFGEESVTVNELITTTKSSSFADENMMHKKDETSVNANKIKEVMTSSTDFSRKIEVSATHLTVEKITNAKNQNQMEIPLSQQHREFPLKHSQHEEDETVPNIVTSRPIHIVSLIESEEATTRGPIAGHTTSAEAMEEISGDAIAKPQPMNFGEQNMMRKLNEMEKIEQITGTDAKHPTVKDDLFARQEQKGKQEETSENERLQTKEEKGNEETQKNDKGETPNELKSQTEQTENPFNISPDVFEVTESNGVSTQGEAESKMTMQEPSEPSTTASVEKIAPVPSEVPTSPTFVEEVQPLPDSFVPPKGPCPTPNDQLDNNRSDVLFLLDSSSSFNENKFKHAIQLIVETVQNFNNFGPDGLQISLVQYNSEPYLEFSLRKHNCKNFLIDDIFDTEYMQGSNMLGKALEKVSKFAFTKKRGDRADAENILIIVTDGESDDKVQQPVEVARQNNVTVLVVASLEANPNHLSDLTGLKDNVFHLGKETAVPLSHKLANRIAMISAEHFYSTLIPTLENKDKVHVVSGVEDENINVVQETDEQQASTKVIQSVIHESHESHGIVGLKCFSNGFKVTLNLPPSFEGVALIKGYGELEQCRKEIASSSDATRSVEFFVSSGSCGMARVKSLEPPGYNSSLILYLIHNRALITGEDKAYLLQCFYGLSTDYSEVMTNLDVLKGDIMLAETISLSSIPPTCSYSIRRDSPHGPIISKAVVGQTVFHRWDCDGGEEANNVYGIQVHNCYASDDVEEKFPIIDNRGCSSDLAILSDPTYSEDRLTAFAQSRAFGFLDTDSLKFICKLSLCTRDGDGCEGITPPSCGPNSSDLLLTRRIRHQNSALESALTSALSTKVGVTMTGPSVFQQRIIELGLSKFTWMLVAATFAVAIGTVILTRFARAPSDSTTTYSDPESGILEDSISPFQPHVSMEALTISHPTDNGYKPHFDILHRSTDPRLMEFMKDFDRSKYI